LVNYLQSGPITKDRVVKETVVETSKAVQSEREPRAHAGISSTLSTPPSNALQPQPPQGSLAHIYGSACAYIQQPATVTKSPSVSDPFTVALLAVECDRWDALVLVWLQLSHLWRNSAGV
jgi:hypothetical protein